MEDHLIEGRLRDVPDFPKKGIVFKDITPLLQDPATFAATIDRMAESASAHPFDLVCGIESRGFLFGAALAKELGKGFIPIRKHGKLPWKTASESYELEYGKDTIEIHVDAAPGGKRVLMVDDLLATGGTMAAALKLVQKIGGKPVACSFLLELAFLGGRQKLGAVPVHALVGTDPTDPAKQDDEPKKKAEAKGKPSSFKKKPMAKPAPKAAAKPLTRLPVKKEELEAVVTRQPGRAAAVEIEARVKARKEAVEAGADEISTEELWTLYRKEAAKKGPKEHKHLEELRNYLIERHYPLVRYIAERLLQTLPKSIELDDLVSAGLFGLMDAIRGFDASRGIKFKTYCSPRIRGAILDQLRSQDWVPRLVRLKASRIERALQRLTAEYGREPTHAELARVLEMEHGDLVNEIQEARAKTMFSLSEKWEDDDGAVEKVEILEDKTATDPVHEMNRRDLMNFITRALTHKERFIIEQYYQYGHTMREIGEMLALTESRVCQIHSNVMSRLKGLLGQRHESLLS